MASVHDALTVGGPTDAIDDAVGRTQWAMADASAIVLDVFRLCSNAKTARRWDRHMNERGRESWRRVMALLGVGKKSSRNAASS